MRASTALERRTMPSLRRILPSSLAVLLALTATARADDIALPRFDPAFAGDRMLGVPSPYVAGDRTFHAALLMDYARDPFILERPSDGAEVGEVVGRQMLVHANATFALWNRLGFNLDIPAALVQTGDTTISRNSADFGDIRLGLRGRLFGELEDPFQLGISTHLFFPTGTGPFVTDGMLRVLPQLVLGGQIRTRLVWSFALGPELRAQRTTDDGVTIGTAIRGGAGMGVLLGPNRALQLGPELTVSQVLPNASGKNLGAELLFHGRYRFLDNFEAALGGGFGLSAGVGTPLFRIVTMIAYTPMLATGLRDTDGDGILNEQDACPEVRGERNLRVEENGCPPLYLPRARDRDGDGVPDDQDGCPRVFGVVQNSEVDNGCPIEDAEDLAVLEHYRKNRPGSSGDTDGDGILDSSDACPEEKGTASEVEAKNGCPVFVRVTDTAIVLLHEIRFDTGSASIQPSSRPMLEELAEVLLQHPEILRIEVQGHTDNRGTLPRNEELAMARARAVRDFLVHRSIAPARLELKAVGPYEPLMTNTTAEGRTRNRRVEFEILEKKPASTKPSSGATTTPEGARPKEQESQKPPARTGP